MQKLPLVAILLSTYNGEKYLREQLDSIMVQTYKNFILYIRDDGSNDNTIFIIKEYEKKYKHKIQIIDEAQHVNLGYKGSFWKLLRKVSEASYYAFCDQDDIWLPEKIEKGILALQVGKCEEPLLYFSSFVYINGKSEIIGDAHKVQLQSELKDLLFYTPAFGFTIIINKKLRDMAINVPDSSQIPHDGWCLKVASTTGKIIYDPFVAAQYRRHEDTVTYSTPSKWIQVKKWLRNDIFGQALDENYFIISNFLLEYKTVLSKEEIEILSIFCRATLFSKKYFQKLFFTKRLRPSWGGEMALRLCFLIGK